MATYEMFFNVMMDTYLYLALPIGNVETSNSYGSEWAWFKVITEADQVMEGKTILKLEPVLEVEKIKRLERLRDGEAIITPEETILGEEEPQ